MRQNSFVSFRPLRVALATAAFVTFPLLALGCSDSASSTASAAVGDAATAGGGPTCADYCAKVMAACTGSNAQFSSLESCLGSCKGLPAGTAADTSGNTVGCRAYHAGVAAASGNAAIHCPHAGPNGGGACGTACEGFCSIQAAACTGANAQFASASDCATKCATIAAGAGPYNTSFTGDDSILCRTYHLSVAATDAPSAATHCSHTALTSPVCTKK